MTVFDAALLAALLLLLPAHALWRSLREGAGRPEPVAARYRRTILLGSALVGALLLIWSEAARPWAALGLDRPFTGGGLVRLSVSAFLLLALAAVTQLRKSKVDPATMERVEAMLPKTGGELAVFPVVMLVVGGGWELLYRGYLLWALEPRIGTVAAILVAAAAYGASHGYRGRGPFVGAMAGALVFTIAYALTRSLWWLMLLHMGLLIVGLLARRAAAAGKG
jgi:membrane protease YdiL (CAAX protease family)